MKSKISQTLFGLLSVSLLSIFPTHAQGFFSSKGFFIGVKSVYAGGYAKGSIESFANTELFNIQNISDVDEDASTLKIKEKRGSYAHGFRFESEGGYMINKNFGVLIGGGYLLGSPIKSALKSSDFGISYDLSSKAGMGFITSGAVIAANIGSFRPYVSGGVTIGLAPSIETTVKGQDASGGFMQYKDKAEGKAPVGSTVNFGIAYDISKRIGVFSEFSMVSMSYKPSKITVKEFTMNGVDMRPILGQSEKNLVDEVDYSSGPENAKGYKVPMSSMGVTVGTRVYFGL